MKKNTKEELIKNLKLKETELADLRSRICELEKIRNELAESKEQLKYRYEIEELVSRLSTRFINIAIEELDGEINSAMKTIGEFVGVDRCYMYLFSLNTTKINLAYEWCGEGVMPRANKVKGMIPDPKSWSMKKLSNFETVITNRIDELPPEAIGEREISLKEGLKSVLFIPLAIRNKLIGFLGFSAIRQEKLWVEEDIRILKMAGEIFVNVFSRKWAEEEKKRMDERLRDSQKFESLGVMAGGFAHDFNNILAAILGYAEIALMSISPDSPARNNINKIIKSSHRAAGIIKQILAYSGMSRFLVEQCNLSRVIREMTQILEVSVSKKSTIKYYLSDEIPDVEGDIAQITQVILNLVINASEAIGENNGIITIRTGAMKCNRNYFSERYFEETLPEGLYVYLEISDTGCGMPEEVRYKIFDPFFTTKFTGRGLGMAAVQGIVRSHKGTIKVYTEEGQGSTIKVLLPAIAGEVKASEENPETYKGTILVVDDEDGVREVAQTFLEKAGFKVLVASDGREGVEIFRSHSKEIIAVLLDMTMPVMNGKEAYDKMYHMKNDVKFFLSSGYNEKDIIDKFSENELEGFIQKPYTSEKLLDLINKCLEK